MCQGLIQHMSSHSGFPRALRGCHHPSISQMGRWRLREARLGSWAGCNMLVKAAQKLKPGQWGQSEGDENGFYFKRACKMKHLES